MDTSRLVQDAYRMLINQSFYNNQSNSELSYSAIRGMMSGINDPFAELIEPDVAQDLVKTFADATGVAGLYAENQESEVVIKNISPDSAAEQEGLGSTQIM